MQYVDVPSNMDESVESVDIPDDILRHALSYLSFRDLISFSETSSKCNRIVFDSNARSLNEAWRTALSEAVPVHDDIALFRAEKAIQAILERVDPTRRLISRHKPHFSSVARYPLALLVRALAIKRVCVRCRRVFTDGTNTPESCQHHPGTMISGARLNGVGLRWTCCNARGHQRLSVLSDHDSTGCRNAPHTARGSLSFALVGDAGTVPEETTPRESQLLDLPAMLGVPPDHPWVSPNATIGGDAPPAPRSAPPLEVIRGLRCAGEAMQKETVEPAQRLWPATKAVEWSPEGASCVEIACSNLWR